MAITVANIISYEIFQAIRVTQTGIEVGFRKKAQEWCNAMKCEECFSDVFWKIIKIYNLN